MERILYREALFGSHCVRRPVLINCLDGRLTRVTLAPSFFVLRDWSLLQASFLVLLNPHGLGNLNKQLIVERFSLSRRSLSMLVKSFALLGAAGSLAHGLKLDVNDTQSIKDVSSNIAYNLMNSYYTGNKTGGSVLLPQPYYWWEAGAMYGGLVDYWFYTGDSTYNDNVGKAIVSQASSTVDFMLPDQRFDLGNDDQGFWVSPPTHLLTPH